MVLIFALPDAGEVIEIREKNGKKEYYIHFIECKYFN